MQHAACRVHPQNTSQHSHRTMVNASALGYRADAGVPYSRALLTCGDGATSESPAEGERERPPPVLGQWRQSMARMAAAVAAEEGGLEKNRCPICCARRAASHDARQGQTHCLQLSSVQCCSTLASCQLE
jgi:hypothetical protein